MRSMMDFKELEKLEHTINYVTEFDEVSFCAFICAAIDTFCAKNDISSVELAEEMAETIKDVNKALGTMDVDNN